MKPEDKELLLKDLCARLPYRVKCKFIDSFDGCEVDNVLHPDDITALLRGKLFIKPYLRPMSSQTSEEREELNNILEYQYYSDDSCMCEASDWLNAHHFDYRGLIEKGLAIEVTEENNPYKN